MEYPRLEGATGAGSAASMAFKARQADRTASFLNKIQAVVDPSLIPSNLFAVPKGRGCGGKNLPFGAIGFCGPLAATFISSASPRTNLSKRIATPSRPRDRCLLR